MKSNRLFYIGLGCVLSTLCWIITAVVAPENQSNEQKMKILKVDRLICSELMIVDSNDNVVISMLNQHPGEPNLGAILAIQDMRPNEKGEVTRRHLTLYGDGLGIYNANNKTIIALKNLNEGGLLWARNAKNEATWIIDANSRKPIPRPSPKEN